MRPIILSALVLFFSISHINITYAQLKKEKAMHTQAATTTNDDQAAVHQVIATLFQAVDNRQWAAVKNTMADSVYTDYSALGGQVGFFTPDEILQGWQAVLPGFERTIHQVHNEAIWIAGDRATATFDGIATHYLTATDGDDFWSVFVGYDTEFIKENDTWKLARIDLSLHKQAGNTSLSQAAIKNVQSGKVPSFVSESKATEAAERFFQALENQDLTAFLANIGTDAVQAMPFSPNNFPKTLAGKAALEQQYKKVMTYTQRYKRTYFPTQNPNVVLAKYTGTIVTEAGKDYNNAYVSIFEVNEKGLLIRNVEHFNPNVLLESWTGLQPETYSVHAAGAKRDGGVTMQQVSFTSQGLTLQGHLFLPPNFDQRKQYPTVIVTGSWTSVKEQMPDEYAS
ncbi:MAG: nuclear transport factor 2 family protein [Thermonemataceae bacterium]